MFTSDSSHRGGISIANIIISSTGIFIGDKTRRCRFTRVGFFQRMLWCWDSDVLQSTGVSKVNDTRGEQSVGGEYTSDIHQLNRHNAA